MAFFNFDANTVAPDTSHQLMPAGVYTARIIESNVEPLKSGNGTGLKLTMEIIDGQFKNRRLWPQLNVTHTNPVAQQIGQQQLSSICRAVNVMNLQDTQQLHNKPLRVKVKIRQDAVYGDKNEVSGFEPLSATGGMPQMPQMPATQQAAPAAAKPSAPWSK